MKDTPKFTIDEWYVLAGTDKPLLRYKGEKEGEKIFTKWEGPSPQDPGKHQGVIQIPNVGDLVPFETETETETEGSSDGNV